MKFIIVLAAIVLAVAANNDSQARSQWVQFKSQHNKVYKNQIEETARFAVFRSNLNRIAEHNAKFAAGETTWEMGVNQFADMTGEEFQAYLGTSGPMPKPTNAIPWTPNPTSVRSDAFDWRDKGAVSGVKNQGQCGSCWSFSTTGSLETQFFLANGRMETFSEQCLMDCSRDYGNNACEGGWMASAFNYISDHGIPTEAEYPYEAVDASCRANGGNTHISAYYQLVGTGDEANMKLAVEQAGTISVSVDATNNMQLYKSGVFNDNTCDVNVINHGVLIVGFGSDNGNDFWTVKNSWGEGWGENGYIRMSRNKNNQCGLCNYGFFPGM